MKFRTVPVTFPCLLNHLEAVMQSKSRLYLSAIWFKQLCSANSAQEKALPGPQTYPSVYWPSVPFLYLDTVKLLQAKFTLNIVPLSTVSEITPSVNLISCRVFGDQRHSMGQGLPSWIFVQMPSERCSHSTAFIHCSAWPWQSVVSGHCPFLLLCRCLPQIQRECKYAHTPSLRID